MNVPASVSIDWDALRLAARAATKHSYAPYSNLQVGVAALLADGRIITGCNVENASFGLTFCAEITMIGRLRMEGVSPLVAVAAADQFDRQLTPCGRCRQILMEHGGPDLLVDGPSGPRPMRELLPEWFGPEKLPT
jgi:cytidine deaminase